MEIQVAAGFRARCLLLPFPGVHWAGFWHPASALAPIPPKWPEAFLPGAGRRGSPLSVAVAVICIQGGVRLKREGAGGAGRAWLCSLVGIQALNVVLSREEIFSGARPMLEVDLTHTGPVSAVSLVTSPECEPPRSAQGINFLSASHMSRCPGQNGATAGERALTHLGGLLAIGPAPGTPLFPPKGRWEG